MKNRALALSTLAALAITACGVSPDDTYNSVENLQSALESEGFRCDSDEITTFDEGYAEEITCSDSLTIAVWEGDYPDYVSGPDTFAMGYTMFSRGHVLKTDTWVIFSTNTDLIREIAPVFGGDYYGRDEELQDLYNPN